MSLCKYFSKCPIAGESEVVCEEYSAYCPKYTVYEATTRNTLLDRPEDLCELHQGDVGLLRLLNPAAPVKLKRGGWTEDSI